MPRRYYSSTAGRTTLASGVTDSATSFSVVAVSGWPSSFPYTLIIDQDTVNEEIVQVTARSGTSLTVVRAVDGTTGVAHSAGAAVNHGVSARDFDEPNAHIESTSNPHSVTAAQAGALALAGGTVTGPTVVDVNSTSTALRVTQTGTGNALVVEDSSNPDSTPFVVDSSGNLGIGSNPAAKMSIYDASSAALLVNGDAGTLIRVTRRSSNANGGNLELSKSRGTQTSPTTVNNGDVLGDFLFTGYDGSTSHSTILIRGSVNGAVSSGVIPSDIQFFTSATSGAGLTERMRINSAGNVGIGISTPNFRLDAYQATTSDVTVARVVSDAAVTGESRTSLSVEKGAGFGGSISGYINQGVGAGLTLSTTNSGVQTERMRIDNAGNVGIGTTAPSRPLDVRSATEDNSAFWNTSDSAFTTVKQRFVAGTANSGIADFTFQRQNSTATDFLFSLRDSGGTVNERMRFSSAGLITGTGPSLGAWTAYTPTLSGWTLGNGVIYGNYCRIGKTVHLKVLMILGSTTTVSDFPIFTVPINTESASFLPASSANASDISAAKAFNLSVRWASASAVALFGTGGVNGEEVFPSSTSPFTWASGDTITFGMTYETNA